MRFLAGLKRILKMAWNDQTKDVIYRALRSWPKRCRPIYNYHRSHIKHLLKLEAGKLYGLHFIT